MNAVDKTTAIALHKAFQEFDQDDAFSVAILTGAGTFPNLILRYRRTDLDVL
jgi:enoyl-CoA hydratase/carnithine racemase